MPPCLKIETSTVEKSAAPSPASGAATSAPSPEFWTPTEGETRAPGPRHAILLVLVAAVLGCEDSGSAPSSGSSSATDPVFFTEITTDVGLAFVHEGGAAGRYFMPEVVGAGAALFDYDSDGDLDIYLVNGTFWDDPDRDPLRNHLLRREADGTYRDVTVESGLGDTGYGMGVAIGDIDNDGHPDVYVTNYGPDAFYRNLGDGSFENRTAAAGLGNEAWGTSATFWDLDGDGFLDLYVVNYVVYPRLKVCQDAAGRREYCGPLASPPARDCLFFNNGDGTFRDESRSSGISRVAGRGLGVLCADFDGDGGFDVFVSNDGEANFLWTQGDDRTFIESALIMGVAFNGMGNAEASMGVTAGDVDGDGDLDLFMTHLARESNTLYRNNGMGSFDDATAASGLSSSSLSLTGFGTAFLDVDNDGDLDLAVVNGRVSRTKTPVGGTLRLAAYAEPNQLFFNDGRGHFRLVSSPGESFAATVETSRGLAVGDIDGDGGLDLLVTNCHGPARLYRNVTPGRGHWLTLQAYDPALKRDVYGARIVVRAGGRTIRRTVHPAYSYASSSDPRVHIGLGDTATVDGIEVHWPDGVVEAFDAPQVDRVVTLRKATGRVVGR